MVAVLFAMLSFLSGVVLATQQGDSAQHRLATVMRDFTGYSKAKMEAKEVSDTVTVCNAYTYEAPLDVVLLRTGDMVAKSLAYKECRDITNIGLVEADQLQFKAHMRSMGVFFCSGIPQGSSHLLLVAHRKRVDSLLMKFSSHAFQPGKEPLLVALDTYLGNETSSLHLAHDDLKANVMHVDDLDYGSVVAFPAGHYQVKLEANPKHTLGVSNMTATQGRGFVALRVGGGGYQQDLVVFPASGSAFSLRLSCIVCMALLLAVISSSHSM